MELSFRPLQSESVGLEKGVVHFMFTHQKISDRCPPPHCWEPTYTVGLRSSCMPSICGFADNGLLTEKCTCLQVGLLTPIKSGDGAVLPGLWASGCCSERSILTTSQVNTSTALLTLPKEDLGAQTLHKQLVVGTSSC
ncbi:hypothetical protein HJG60_012091 [Phyllostomus discolor]|uniref:Uncharacterized protein n=1 Tax=Phyllostomus discolor TaxID=89673 RepID=A0A833ZPI2_9CHIR|nr:hypothetical protein HJG60_012091 [Phyllostomus discolor]